MTVDPFWRLRSACALSGHHSELWASSAAGDRQLAIHTCREHCPVLRECRAMLGALPGMVVGGQAYSSKWPWPALDLPPDAARCPFCHEHADWWSPPPDFEEEPVRELVPGECGTPAAYERHRRRREPIDDVCRRANLANKARLARLAKRRNVGAYLPVEASGVGP